MTGVGAPAGRCNPVLTVAAGGGSGDEGRVDAYIAAYAAGRVENAILPPWCRKTPKITGVLPLMYLHGLSSGDFVPAPGRFPGSSAGLSPAGLLRDCARGGMRAPVLAAGDGALGFWNALREVFPEAAAKITRGPGSRAAGLAMAFGLIESGQDRWRAVSAPRLVALARAGATFINAELAGRAGAGAEHREAAA